MDDTVNPPVVSGVPMAPPPTGYAPVAEWVLADSVELSRLRSALARIVGSSGDGATAMHDTAEKIVLIASELATNALLHGLPPTVVRLLRDEHTWLLDVVDHDAAGVPRVDGGRPPGHGGLGLLIAERLSAHVGWYTSGPAKHVWATFPRDQRG
ncbi:ATP-binding protein [Isoptericola sp. NPDC056605]|uniref:ATP-binding protein n=1 Tax=Isoptericola sp. NPDC056605 TaxID=3345876 RepID=UPI0036889E28